MNNKKGVSGVIMAVIMIVIVLVAIGIYFSFVRTVIDDSTGSVGVQASCLKVQLEVNAGTSCTDLDTCALDIQLTGEIPDGLKVVFSNATTGSGGTLDSVTDLSWTEVTLVNIASGIDPGTTATPDSITVTAYYNTADGEVLCTNTVNKAI